MKQMSMAVKRQLTSFYKKSIVMQRIMNKNMCDVNVALTKLFRISLNFIKHRKSNSCSLQPATPMK